MYTGVNSRVKPHFRSTKLVIKRLRRLNRVRNAKIAHKQEERTSNRVKHEPPEGLLDFAH